MIPKISIVIPSYNKVKYIGQTLKSIFDQKYPNLQVIIEDGGSTDGTLKIIKEFTSKYPKQISYVSKKDGGQLEAINNGLGKANGEIITFINADDKYAPGSFDSVIKAFKKSSGKLWFVGKGIVINEDGNEIARLVTFYKNILFYLNSYSLLLTNNYLIQPSVFLTKNAITRFGKFSGTKDFVMEYDYWLKLGKVEMPITINKVLSKFRIEATTKTKTMYKDLLMEDERIVAKYTNNTILLLVHRLNNFGRIIVQKFID